MTDAPVRIAFIGMGEAGTAFVSGWGTARAPAISAFDIKTDDPATAPELQARFARLGITGCASLSEALDGADLVFSTVTADQAAIAARNAAAHLAAGAYFCDMNSCSPGTKRASAEAVEAASGRYVDVAVMAPVHPKKNLTPLLLSGPHAESVLPVLAALPMSGRVVTGGVGAASSIKITRSIMVKGLEALTAECFLAAEAAGVREEVMASLEHSHPGFDWRGMSGYNLERMLHHGHRRAAEMEQAVEALIDLGLPGDMSKAATQWQTRVAETEFSLADDSTPDGQALAKALIPHLRKK